MRLSTTAIVVLDLLLLTVPAIADDKANSQKHFEAGIALLESEDFDAAAIEFEQSVTLYPTKSGLFNLANSQKALHQYAQALATFQRLRSEFGSDLDAEMKAAINEVETSIEKVVSRVTLDVDQDGATITMDGEEVGETPLNGPLVVGPGDHTIEVSKRGRQDAREEFSAVSGQEIEISIRLRRKRNGVSLSPVPLIVAGGITAALGVTTIVLDAKVGDRFDTADKTGVKADRDTAESLQTTEKIFFGLTIASAVTAGVLAFFTDYSGEKKAESGDIALDSVTPVFIENGGGMAVGGSF